VPYLEFPLAQGWTRGLTICFGGIQDTIEFDIKSAIFLKQVHGNALADVGSLSKAPTEPLGPADGAYAFGESFKNSGLKIVIRTADCLPLFYVDHKNHKVAGVHAGWRGLVQKIHLLPFKNLGFDPKTTWVWVGPSLSRDDFEVKSDMWTQFDSVTQGDSKIFSPHSKDTQQKLFDPWALIDRDFKSLGVELVYNVEVNTYRDPKLASYRRACHQKTQIPLPHQNFSWIGFSAAG
jgi:YfiH family protein